VAIVSLLPLFCTTLVAIEPGSAQSFTVYMNLDQNLGAFYKAYYSVLPSRAELSQSLRRILDQSKSFPDLVPRLSGAQTLVVREMPQRPHVIFILADGLRRMSYGDPPHDERRYPGLALLKRHSVEYSNAWTSYNATAASMPALLAGAWNPVWYEAEVHYEHDNVLARAAEMSGYRLYSLAAFAGVDTFWPAGSAVAIPNNGDSVGDPRIVLPEALTILDEHERSHPGQPAFLYVHLFATHQPLIYRPESPYDAIGRHWTLALYENNVAYLDANLRLFLEALDKRGKLQDSLLLAAADHGEEFFEQGISLLAQHRNPPQRQYFPLFSWLSPLIGEVRSHPLSMYVVDAQTGRESLFKPVGNSWKISMEGSGTASLSPESLDITGHIFSFWRGKTSGSNH
jgi:hypothetical protein